MNGMKAGMVIVTYVNCAMEINPNKTKLKILLKETMSGTNS